MPLLPPRRPLTFHNHFPYELPSPIPMMRPTTARRRALRACHQCRSRKVRCITVEGSRKCVSCQLDGKCCDWNRDRKRETIKLPTQWPADSSSSKAPYLAGSFLVASVQGQSDNKDGQTLSESSPMSTEPHTLPMKSVLRPLFARPSPSSTAVDYSYSFLQPPTIDSLLPQDQAFLIKQGCFVLPRKPVMDEFVRHYFLYVHPMLPLLDEGEFWDAYNHMPSNKDAICKVPIIVMQAILFVASSFVSNSTISALGFTTAHSAKGIFHRRAKLLYDFHCEPSPIAISQAALLLSHSHLTNLDHTESARQGSMWLGNAIFHARDAKANLYDSLPSTDCRDAAGKTSHQSRLKRLWWCCIIRDRLMPLTSRRHINIDHSNFDFSRNSPLTSTDISGEIDKSLVHPAATKSVLADGLIGLVKLCVILTDVLSLASTLQDHSAVTTPWINTKAAEVRKCKEVLVRWKTGAQELNAHLIQRLSVIGDSYGNSSKALTLFMKLLDIYYYSAVLTLCHHEMMLFDLTATSLDISYRSWRLAENADQVEEAVCGVTGCLQELTHLKVTQCLPLSVVGCAALPLAFKALDIKLRQGLGVGMTLNRNERQDDVLSQVVEICKPRHTAIEWVIEAVESNTTTAYQRLTTMQFRTENSQSWTTSWTQVLRLKPRQYLYLIAAMDFSISKGKLPDENDLPASLRDISADVNFGSSVSEAPTLDLATAWMLEDLTTGFKGANQVNNHAADNTPFKENFGDVELAAEMGMIGEIDSLGDMTLFGSPFAVVGSAQLRSSTTCENSRKDRDAFEHDAETTATDSAVLPVDVINLTEPSNLQGAAQTIQPRTNSPASISTKHSNAMAHQEWGLIEADPAQWGHAVVQGDILSLGFGIDYASLEAVRGLKGSKGLC